MKQSEERLHAQIYIFFHNTYPQYRGLLCYNHSNATNVIEGNKNKVLGLQKGRSDFSFYFDGRAYFIELKTDVGKQSPDQKKWEFLVTSHYFEYVIIRSLEEFQSYINNIISNNAATTISGGSN